jgi:integrase
MKFPLRYIFQDRDRHGNERLYVRRNGRKIRIKERWGTTEFLDAYQAALVATETPKVEIARIGAPAERGTFRWLVEQYYRSAEFNQFDDSTKRVRRGILDGLCARYGPLPYARLEPHNVRRLRDEKAMLPEAANARLKAMRQVFKWACDPTVRLADRNPARDVPYFKAGSQGCHCWSTQELQRFEERHPVGTCARLAFAILLYTGQRRSDAVRLGRQHMKDGRLVFTQEKNKKRNPVRLEIPIHPELHRIIDASPVGDLTFLVTEFKRPFTAAGFGNKMREWCDQAGLHHCSAHGLRKAAASRLAECGASEHEIMAITGHRTLKEVDRYTRGARQRVLADAAMKKFAAGHLENEIDPPQPSAKPSGSMRGKKS